MRSNESLIAPLDRYLTGRLSEGEPVRVTHVRRIAVGHSRAMFMLDTSLGRQFVLRMEQGGVFGTSSAGDVRLMRARSDCDLGWVRILALGESGLGVGFVGEWVFR